MAEALQPRCETCRYYAALQGQCRFNPPRPFLLPGAMGKVITTASFPPTEASNWCGKHEPSITMTVTN